MDAKSSVKQKLIVTATPHIRSKETVSDIMLDVIIALAPAAVMGAFYFGLRAAALMALSVGSAVLFEFLYRLATRRDRTINDLSAVVTGLLLAFGLPPSAPFWVPVVGAAFAIVIVKQLFGGIGQNFVNPALAARAFLLASYPGIMASWSLAGISARIDAVSTATPLAQLKDGAEQLPSLLQAFLGNRNGSLGETCVAAILAGLAYLLIKRIISWRIPVTYIASFALVAWIMGREGAFTGNPLYELCLGSVMLGAVFMATDYTTSPVTPIGQIIMGVGCGALNAVFRLRGGFPEGTTYAILIMNLAVPLIDKFTKPRIYGEVKKHGHI
ncbi:MAG: RnfABCDGE type electron transport complex subunit D [Clostridiales bacterium]|jgi:electron transport complex protein RnfD|nr:RnfABCDGE type electron transport complex subunit D [Clostridiales bacterium]